MYDMVLVVVRFVIENEQGPATISGTFPAHPGATQAMRMVVEFAFLRAALACFDAQC